MFTKTWPFTTYSALPAEFTFTRGAVGAYWDSAGVLSIAAIDAPRFDHNPVTLEPLGLLLEGTRTNYLYPSEDFSTTWVPDANTSIVVNQATAPDGTVTFDAIQAPNANPTEKRTDRFALVVVPNGITRFSIFVKAGRVNHIALAIIDSTTKGVRRTFDIVNGVEGTSSDFNGPNTPYTEIQDCGNGVWRITVGLTATGVGTVGLRIQPVQVDGSLSYVAVPNEDEVYVWGAQVEVGDSASAYIATTSGTSIRHGDRCAMGPDGGLPFVGYNATEGTFALSYSVTNINTSLRQAIMQLSDGTNDERFFFKHDPASAGDVSFTNNVGGVSVVNFTLAQAQPAYELINAAVAYKVNDYEGTANAYQPMSKDTSAGIPGGDRINLGTNFSFTSAMFGHIATLTYFDERLPGSSVAYLSVPVRTVPRTLQTLIQAAYEEEGKTASSQLAMQVASEAEGITASAQLAIMVAHYPDVTESIRAGMVFIQAATVDLTGKPASSQQSMLVAYRTGVIENLSNRAWAFALDGHTFYVITLGDTGTFVYDQSTNEWAQWQTAGMPVWNMEIGTTWKGRIIAADQANAVIWALEPRSFLDDDFKPITRRVSGGLSLRQRLFIENYAFRITASLGKFDLPTTVPATIPTVGLRVSDDQGHTWFDAGTLTLVEGKWTQKLAWTSLGTMQAPQRIFEVTDTGGVTRIDGADAEIGDDGTDG